MSSDVKFEVQAIMKNGDGRYEARVVEAGAWSSSSQARFGGDQVTGLYWRASDSDDNRRMEFDGQ